MIEILLGSKSKEQILLFLEARKEAYAREIADFYNTSLSPIQNQLEKLESSGILVSKQVGKTVVYSFNPRYAFYNELKGLLEKVIQFLPEKRKNELIYKNKTAKKEKTVMKKVSKMTIGELGALSLFVSGL